MRAFFAFCVLLVLFPNARAQDQEHKLVDRLLRPDTTLGNEAQNKTFRADGLNVQKRANVREFYVAQKSKQKTFTQTRDFSSWQFNSRSFHKPDDSTVKFMSKQSVRSLNRTYPVSFVTNLHPVYDADRTATRRDYPGNRPFLNEGKSQKSLSQKKPAMTIDQVRELLNKNK